MTARNYLYRAFGAVYKAIHVPTTSVVAVKSIPMNADSAEAQDMKKEIDILRECRHDNIVSLYGCMFSQTGDLWVWTRK